MDYESTIRVVNAKDGNLGRGYGRISTGHPTQGATQGETRPMYQYAELGDDQYSSDDKGLGDEKDLEDPDQDMLDDIGLEIVRAIRTATGSGKYSNPNRSGRKDNASASGRNQTRLGIAEDADHTTTAVRGLSPRMPYRQKGPTGTVPRNNKGPSFGSQSTAQYIRNAPGRKGGTHFGTARAPLPRHDEYDENIFSLMDLSDPMERSFLNQQKRVNKIKNMVNLIEKE